MMFVVDMTQSYMINRFQIAPLRAQISLSIDLASVRNYNV